MKTLTDFEFEELKNKAKKYDEIHAIMEKFYEYTDEGDPVDPDLDLVDIGEAIATYFKYL